jgi:hypothetical protein
VIREVNDASLQPLIAQFQRTRPTKGATWVAVANGPL